MKKLYIIIILFSFIITGILALTFFYLDQQRRQTFLYELYYDNVLSGYEKVDRYLLENSLIYKSTTELPRDILRRKYIRKIVFDARGKDFIHYKKDVSSNGATDTLDILSGPEEISFLATGNASFSYLKKVPSHGNDLIFESEAIATYPSLIRRYNFKRGGEQFVNVLIPISNLLPPIRQVVSLTSIGKDTIEIEGRKINCERLVFELKNGDLISAWITRIFHNIVMVDMPKYGFKAILCAKKKNIPVEEYRRKSDLYIEKEATFSNEETLLYGTISVPTTGNAPYPAALLIWDSGSMDRDSFGIFADIAHTLAGAGYCVLRFDKRGIGQSQGFFSTYAQSEQISDLKCGIDFLKALPEVDKSCIVLLGHSEGGFYAAYLSGSDKDVRGCIIMSVLSSLSPVKNDCSKLKKLIKNMVPADEEYLKSAITAVTQSREIIKDKGDWITLLNKRVFTKKMNLEDKYNMLNTIKKLKVPVLILHGKKDNMNLTEEAEELGDALAEGGNNNFTTIYFSELGHFFGTIVKESPARDHSEVDPEVLKSITEWLDKNLNQVPAEAPAESIAIPEYEKMNIDELQKISEEKEEPSGI